MINAYFKLSWFTLFCLLFSFNSWAQDRNFTGRVFDLTGEPLVGATVLVQGSEDIGLIGTITDMDGFFEINAPTGLDSLKISFTGYETKILKLGQKKFLEIFLSPSHDKSFFGIVPFLYLSANREHRWAKQLVVPELYHRLQPTYFLLYNFNLGVLHEYQPSVASPFKGSKSVFLFS